MRNRRIAANYVITNSSDTIKNGCVIVNEENGEIVGIEQLREETADTEFYNGILVPGFVNAHCHLELCHLKDKVKDAKSLVDFLSQMFKLDGGIYNEELTANYDKYMFETGVSACGDICNTSDTANVKKNSKIHYKNFVELIGTVHSRCINDIVQYNNVWEKYTDFSLNPEDICAVPHSPYFVSPELFDIINDINKDDKSIISIHNQETFEENLLYKDKTGEFIGRFPIDLGPIPVTGKTTLQSMNQLVDANYDKILLVHNIYTSKDDLDFAKTNFKNPYFVICPKSNILLEKRMTDINAMIERNLNICIGTDSLSSNDNLSMIEEMYVMQEYYKTIKLEDIIKFATINGARALGFDNDLGTIEIGKKPGLVLIENADLQNFKLTKSTTSRRLV